MTEASVRRWRLSPLWLVLIAAAASFLTGIHWGLPSRSADPFLFGEVEPWSGAKIISLAPAESDNRGADVDANPIADRTKPVIVNATDAQRAEIVRRYRLFSHQPDEMITLKSLARLRENKGDPRLYQYGGLWIYPVGVLLKLASIVGYVDLRPDQAFYLDHPEAFGRFYVVARAYSAACGLAAAAAVFWIVRRITSHLFLATIAGICFAALPVVVNLAHEAKPHLPGTMLMLLAVIAALKFVEKGRTRDALLAGALCGAAFGMVISALLSFAILFAMFLLRADSVHRRATALALSMSLGVFAYAITNPFVLINVIARPERFQSNVQNSTAMYSTSVGGVMNAMRLVVEGASPMIAIVGVAGIFFLAKHAAGKLLLAPAALVAVMFFALAADKPPEYARFALLLDVTLLIAAFALIAQMKNAKPRAAMAVLLLGFTILAAVPYWGGFVRDCRPVTSRLAAAEQIKKALSWDDQRIGILAEPAPYILPPVDLFKYELTLFPPGKPAFPDLSIALDTAHAANPMSWADVRFIVNSTRRAGAATVSSPP